MCVRMYVPTKRRKLFFRAMYSLSSNCIPNSYLLSYISTYFVSTEFRDKKLYQSEINIYKCGHLFLTIYIVPLNTRILSIIV
jgi:hypothetical protein